MIKKIKRKFFDLRFRYFNYRRIKIIIYNSSRDGRPSVPTQVGSFIIKCKGYPEAWDIAWDEHYEAFILGDHMLWFEVI